MDYIIATRPWSFTAAIVPVMIVAAVTESSLVSLEVLQVLLMSIFIQAGANLTNTYFDYVNGIDTKENPGDDTLIVTKVTEKEVLFLSWGCYTVGIFLACPVLLNANFANLSLFLGGILLAYFYTATPVGLKYMALGDLVIFVCFGPLLMQFTSVYLTGEMRKDIYLYSVPISCFTEAILHANNSRDIETDSKAGAVTLATVIGPSMSYTFYVLLFVFAYSSAMVIAIWYCWGVSATLLTFPLTISLLNFHKAGKMQHLPEETAKVHLPFGVALFLGVLLTKNGLVDLFL